MQSYTKIPVLFSKTMSKIVTGNIMKSVLFSLLVLLICALAIFFINYPTQQVQSGIPNAFHNPHILAGFNIDSPQNAENATVLQMVSR